MSVAMIWGPPGSGKTVAATAPKKEKIKLLCSDNSSVVLDRFERPNVDVERVEHWLEQEGGRPGNYFSAQFEKALAGKYTLIVVDNLTDLKDLALLEIEERGQIKDIRQIYQAVYQALKRLTRLAANAKCHVTLTAWDAAEEFTTREGKTALRMMPNIPRKILPNIVGLCNVVGMMAKSKDSQDRDVWFLVTEDSELRYGCKDQLFCRKSCMPENIFEG